MHGGVTATLATYDSVIRLVRSRRSSIAVAIVEFIPNGVRRHGSVHGGIEAGSPWRWFPLLHTSRLEAQHNPLFRGGNAGVFREHLQSDKETETEHGTLR